MGVWLNTEFALRNMSVQSFLNKIGFNYVIKNLDYNVPTTLKLLDTKNPVSCLLTGFYLLGARTDSNRRHLEPQSE